MDALLPDDASIKHSLLTELAPCTEMLGELGFVRRLSAEDGELAVRATKGYRLGTPVNVCAKHMRSGFTARSLVLAAGPCAGAPFERLSVDIRADECSSSGGLVCTLARGVAPPADATENEFIHDLDAAMTAMADVRIYPRDVHGLCCTLIEVSRAFAPAYAALVPALLRYFAR